MVSFKKHWGKVQYSLMLAAFIKSSIKRTVHAQDAGNGSRNQSRLFLENISSI